METNIVTYISAILFCFLWYRPKKVECMADVKMNQLATATDGAYIYAEAEDGSQVKISKSNLITALGLSGTIIKKWSADLSPDAERTIGNVQGLVYVRCGYSYGGFLLYLATFIQVTLIANPIGYGIGVQLSIKNGELTVKNTDSIQKYIEIYYQSLGY